MKIIDEQALADLTAQAMAAPRQRANRNLHADLGDPLQRLVIAFEPGTYVRPHRHPDRFECFILIRGRCVLVTFDEDGRVDTRLSLAGDANRVVEIPAGTWHTLVSLETGTVAMEVKPGPYQPTAAGDFAAWAPAEGDAAVPAFLDRLAASESVVM